MRTHELAVVGSLVAIGVLLALAPRVAAPLPLALTAGEQAPVGQSYVVSVQGIPPDAHNVTLRIVAPNGIVFFRQYVPYRNLTQATISESVPVTRDWGWGNGYVEFAFDNQTQTTNGNVTVNETRTHQLQSSFEMTCPPTCQLAYLNEANAQTAQTTYTLAAVIVILAAAWIGHAATVYATDRGNTSWKDTLGFFFRSRIGRDALYRTKKDMLNLMPETIRDNIAAITATLNEIESTGKFKARALKAARRSRAILAKAGVYERTVPANPISSMKPPEKVSRIAKPKLAAEFDKRMTEE